MVKRLSRAPFLFKFCRVVYEKERKVLRLQDGEFVGRHFRSSRGGPVVDFTIPDEEAVLYLEMKETSAQGITEINTNFTCIVLVRLQPKQIKCIYHEHIIQVTGPNSVTI